MSNVPWRRVPVLAVLALASAAACADEAAIRKTFAERLPSIKIDEVTRSPIAGLYELRVGNDLLYTDENGHFVVQGSIIDTKTRTNLTEARIDKLTALDFASLPLKDAFLIKQGSGTRRVVLFADPNCGYCKKLERDLLKVKDVSIYTFLYPILGPDSDTKARDIWCSKDPAKTWRAWMIDGVAPPKAGEKCDSHVLERNVALGAKHRVQGTPAVVFEDGTRAPGAVPAEVIESRIAAARKS